MWVKLMRGRSNRFVVPSRFGGKESLCYLIDALTVNPPG
jgi:hypothetical protein